MKDVHQMWKHRWLTPKVKVFKSKIFGYAPFAIENIKKNELIRITGGIIISRKDVKKYMKIMGYMAQMQIDDNFFIGPSMDSERKDTGSFNHSCNPNIGFLDSIRIISIRNIKKGEELTIDYAFCQSFFKSFKCNCGSENCRKTIKPTNWKIPEIQKRYGEYFSPYLKIKFKA